MLLGDDIVQAETPCLRQLMNEYEQTLSSVIGVQTVPDNQTHRYGIVDPISNDGRRHQVNTFVEKPAAGTAPSSLAIMGRYVFTPEIFKFLEEQEVGAGGEIQLTDAIQKLNEIQRVFAYDFEGKRYDVGEKLGFIQTTIEFALQHDDLRDSLLTIMEDLLKKETKKPVEIE
ncbi:glucose-1-phosphate uridylyltransferase [Streptococcus pneumoniae]|nr:glucose-1-phosphate uridylyltransferase [Streptococcus pneumoniae]